MNLSACLLGCKVSFSGVGPGSTTLLHSKPSNFRSKPQGFTGNAALKHLDGQFLLSAPDMSDAAVRPLSTLVQSR